MRWRILLILKYLICQCQRPTFIERNAGELEICASPNLQHWTNPKFSENHVKFHTELRVEDLARKGPIKECNGFFALLFKEIASAPALAPVPAPTSACAGAGASSTLGRSGKGLIGILVVDVLGRKQGIQEWGASQPARQPNLVIPLTNGTHWQARYGARDMMPP